MKQHRINIFDPKISKTCIQGLLNLAFQKSICIIRNPIMNIKLLYKHMIKNKVPIRILSIQRCEFCLNKHIFSTDQPTVKQKLKRVTNTTFIVVLRLARSIYRSKSGLLENKFRFNCLYFIP